MSKVISVTPASGDILCGRGITCYQHTGNVQFRDVIALNLPQYTDPSLTKLQKTMMIQNIIDSQSKEGNRFIKEDPAGWVELGKKDAQRKVGQTLRDSAAKILQRKTGQSLKDAAAEMRTATKMRTAAKLRTAAKIRYCQDIQTKIHDIQMKNMYKNEKCYNFHSPPIIAIEKPNTNILGEILLSLHNPFLR
mmetsp:Transcript_28300/g.31319  ORF Transcript_28300/g.31319 Transcript_28300/m.31319 type:complete len:192 (-) Transcript_28300:141-716(-)